MQFFKNIPTITAFDTENYQNNLKVICDAYGNFYEYDNNPENLLNWLIEHSCDLNFLYNLDYDIAILYHAINPKVDVDNNNHYSYGKYEFKYLSNKSLTIIIHETKTRNKIIRFFDIAQFYKTDNFQSLDNVAKQVLGIGKNNEELGINRGKIGNEKGYYEQNRKLIIKYCIQDAYLTMELAKKKIEALKLTLNNQYPKVFNSVASISKAYLSINHGNLVNSYYRLLNQLPLSKKSIANNIIENTFTGGLFYLHSLGKVNNVYEYDLNSAYPYAMTTLYSLENANIKIVNKFEKSDYGFYKVKIRNLSYLPIHYRTGNTEITYIRNKDYVENFLTSAEIEYFQKYHAKEIDIKIINGVVINTTHKLEFTDFNELYNKRKEIKKEIKELKENNKDYLKQDMEQWNIKTILNASYGTFAERKNGYTKFTNMVYASYITALTRIKIYSIIDKIGFEHVKAIMTDAVATDIEIEDKEFNSDGLGNFKLEENFNTVWFYMNGIYVYKKDKKIVIHNRGFPTLNNADMLFNAKGTKLKVTNDKKVIKIKEGIIQHKQQDIGKFTKQTKYLNLNSLILR